MFDLFYRSGFSIKEGTLFAYFELTEVIQYVTAQMVLVDLIFLSPSARLGPLRTSLTTANHLQKNTKPGHVLAVNNCDFVDWHFGVNSVSILFNNCSYSSYFKLVSLCKLISTFCYLYPNIFILLWYITPIALLENIKECTLIYICGYYI